MNQEALRQSIVEEARTWLGTPYVHSGDVKGAGVDCGMLLVRVYTATGVLPQGTDPRPYAANWFLHQERQVYMEWIQKFCHRVENPQPGDIAMYNFGKHPAHAAIIVDDNYMIHAHRATGIVELTERWSYVKQFFDSYWSFLDG